MLALALLVAASKAATGAPVVPSNAAPDPLIPLTIFGRQLVECTRYRTIWNILWSCFSTIIACTWVAVHPNVPDPHDSACRNLIRRVVIMVYAVLAPECMTMWALRQHMGAAKHVDEYNDKFYHEDAVKPSTGWLKSVLQGVRAWFRSRGPNDEKWDGRWTLTHGFLLEMQGLIHNSGGAIEDVEEIPGRLDITREEINDKSKGDLLSKLLVVLQTTWFIFQCITRWITRLPVTELEVITLAYAFLNIVTYTLWLDKPQNMQVAVRMDRHAIREGSSEKKETSGQVLDRGSFSGGGGETQDGSETRQKQSAWVRCISLLVGVAASVHPRNIRLDQIFDLLLAPIDPVLGMMSNNDAEVSRTFYSSWNAIEDWKSVIFFGVTSLVFGALHLIPIWTSSFPSPLESALWEFSAIGITVEPLVWMCVRKIGDLNFERVEIGTLSRIGIFIFFVGVVGTILLAAVARLAIIVIAFTALRNLPPGAYQTVEWTALFPHFGSATN